MEYAVWAGILAGILLLVGIVGWQEKRKRQENCLKRLKKEYGVRTERQVSLAHRACIPAYYQYRISKQEIRPEEGIDDITWNDLDMDRIFSDMNHTYSDAGEEYLYYILRTPAYREEELIIREHEITYFMEHEKERLDLQMVFMHLGKDDKYSLYDYLAFLQKVYDKKKTGNMVWLPAFLMIAAVALLFIRTGVGLISLFVVIAFNIYRYYNLKGRLRPCLNSLRYLVRLFHGGKAISLLPLEICREQMEEIRQLTKMFQPFLKKAGFVFASEAGSGNPLEIVRDYLNMIFHFDLIQMQSMLSLVERKEEEIDRLNTAIGYLEAMIAVGSYRKTLKESGYCIPEFENTETIRQKAVMIYHPLLASPVRNSYEMNRPMLITGSNASGKSTFLKTMAVNQLLAQTVHMVCAEEFHTRFFRIYSSMALTDNLSGGDSYYMVEIKAMKRILEQSAGGGIPVLCFIDEVLRGTNTVERIAASTQILQFLAEQGVACVAATHDIELTMLLENMYDNYHFTETVSGDDISFSYKLLTGRADSRNAIKLLEVMGYDREIVKKAEAMAQHFIKTNQWNG